LTKKKGEKGGKKEGKGKGKEESFVRFAAKCGI
jgi:hypothetical protein